MTEILFTFIGLFKDSELIYLISTVLWIFIAAVVGIDRLIRSHLQADKLILKKIETESENLRLQILLLKSDFESLKSDFKLKSRFYANITHEFRTPLTLLLGPLEEAFQKDTKSFSKTELILMLKNSRKLLRLINQLLEISKIEWGGSGLTIIRGDITELLSTITSFFLSMAEKRQVDFIRNMPLENPLCYFDPEKIEKIVTNLLSNSFKFTTPQGQVFFNVDFSYSPNGDQQEIDNIIISVSDTGIGIDSEKIPKLFDLFYSSDNREGREYEGSGIGLALVKELVEKHLGNIQVVNQIVGVKFIVTLPVNKRYFAESEITTFSFNANPKNINELEYLETPGIEIISKFDKNEFDVIKNSSLILLVEDNDDMRTLIRERFGKQFLIKEAKNGLEGLAMALEIVPDLIITDLVMPRMSGIELCTFLKSDERTNHIPVIMLTGKSAVEERIKGLETGADDYLIKPFNINELQVRVNNLIDQRKKLKERYERDLKIPRNEFSRVISKDEKFLDRAAKAVERNIANSHFSVEDFQKEMGMSRMQLHRKLKALSEKSTSEFIRLIRMKRAAEMILNGQGTISEIAYEVGFNDPSYFTKCFRNEFGIPPSEYKDYMNGLE